MLDQRSLNSLKTRAILLLVIVIFVVILILIVVFLGLVFNSRGLTKKVGQQRAVFVAKPTFRRIRRRRVFLARSVFPFKTSLGFKEFFERDKGVANGAFEGCEVFDLGLANATVFRICSVDLRLTVRLVDLDVFAC